MPRLEVTLGDPRHGWLPVALRVGDSAVEVVASNVLNDPARDLVVALDNLLDPPAAPVVVLWEEPRCVDLALRRVTSDDAVTLEVIGRADWAAKGGRTVLVTHGTIDEIVAPLWRALSALRGRMSAEDFAREWGHPFPDRELAQLGARLRLRR